ncbi:DEAD/DEAH box helicase family protein [Lelliottia wanjuensis]|uniref:hypothetical protein n=1 Tax=Lelliottia wanjuensis TaxID=3050585 RepID=UPI002550A465|nr:hypothetical protein [Lelliottia sp. V86_10]MDK9585880.1 hypothetical protein [Lelliottia sp. V86_10]
MSEVIEVNAGVTIKECTTSKERACVEFVRAVCGAGKTFTYSNHINATPASKFIVAAKTEILCEQIQRGLPDSVLISTENLNLRKLRDKASVTSTICEAVKSYRYRVIVCSHKALELLSMRLHYDDALRLAMVDYQILIDEAPENRKQLQTVIDLSLSGQYPWLAHTVTMNGLMYATDVHELRKSLRAGDTKSAGLIVALINGDKVRVQQLPGENKQLIKCSARSDLYIAASIYNENKVTVIGSLIDKSPWVKTGLRNGFLSAATPSGKIVIPESRNKHHNTSRIKIYILTDKKATKTGLNKHIDEVCAKAGELVSSIGKPFIWASNADFESQFSSVFSSVKGVQVPYKSQGLNSFDEYQVAVWLGCVNLPDHIKKDYGDEPEEATELEEWETLECCYQFLARTVIRKQGVLNTHDTIKPCHFVVLDSHQADYIKQNYFPEAEIVSGFEPVRIERKEQNERVFTKGDKTAKLITDAIEELTAQFGKAPTQKEVSIYTGKGIATVKRKWPKS